jgi:hypothetical protein
MAVPAGVISVLFIVTFLTLNEMTTHCSGSAMCDMKHDLVMISRDMVIFSIFFTIAVQYIGQFH